MGNTVKKYERVVENLNRALHALFATDPHVFLIGEDLLDPYGGAFKVSSGLSSRFPDRILATPLSEGAFLGIASGLTLCGEKVIAEIMFGDFIALGYDQILNFAAKAVSMYGRSLTINLVVRCPVGGNRGYGPTHSQSMQKYFIGIPHLHLFEISPFHDNGLLLNKLVNLGQPCILFEDKVLYAQRIYTVGVIDEYFVAEALDNEQNFVRVFLDEGSTDEPDCVIIAPGLLSVDHIFVVEESVAGGTWGCEVAQQIYERLWNSLKHPVHLIHSKESIIPSAPHLEKQVLVQAEDIYTAIIEAMHAQD